MIIKGKAKEIAEFVKEAQNRQTNQILKNAVKKYGAPKEIYVDDGLNFNVIK